MKKRIASLVLALVLCAALALPAFAEQSGDWEYSVKDNGDAEITGYNGSSAYVEIPAELDGHPVTVIGAFAFYNNAFLAGVTIPGCVKTIGESAFSFCPVLNEVTICDGVTAIDLYAFAQCTALTKVTVPDSVQTIGEMAFGYYTPDNANFLHVSGFTICGSADSAAEQYANANGFSFLDPGACTHGTLICEDCNAVFTRDDLLTEWGYASTASALSEGNLTIIVGVACAVVFGLVGFLLGRKKKPASAGEDE